MQWRLAKSLEVLREQLNTAHADRDRASDGSIGDQAHQARHSEHNPDSNGVVRAIDITNDPAHGVDGHTLSRQLINDSRTYYVIFAGQIWKSRTKDWEAYHGPNAHLHHVHISVVADAHEYDDTAPWKLGDEATNVRALRKGDEGPEVVKVQQKLGIKADGKFGNHTEFAVREWQAFHKIKVDGVIGPETLKTMFGE